jgi:hypothetical protein
MSIVYKTQKVNESTYKVFVESPEIMEFIVGVNNEKEIDEMVRRTVERDFPEITPSYKDLRREAYPPMADYLDGIVKGDQAQVQKYIDDCLAVKVKYPKG